MQSLRRKWQSLPRGVVVLITALAIYVPLSFIIIQSFLSAPFFSPSKVFSLDAFRFIFADSDFYKALKSGFIPAFGLAAIAIPLGGMLAFLMIRTDLPGRRWIEPLILVPIFVSPMVLGFGYVVAAGPVGFFSTWAQSLLGFVPWNVYSLTSIVIIAGLTHVPHAYLYISSALRSMGSDVEEAARVTGASPLRVMVSVSLPMVRPAMLYATVLLFFLGLEVFGLVLVLGDPEGNLVLATYLYKLTNKLGIPSYHLMAAVAVVLICMTIPLVMLQRRLMRTANRFVTVKGKVCARRCRWASGAGWPARSSRSGCWSPSWCRCWACCCAPSYRTGAWASLLDVLSLDAFRTVFSQPNLMRAIVNSVAIGVFGGALAVFCYTFVGWHAPQAGQRHALHGLQRAARGARPAGRPGLPVGVPVRADVAGQRAGRRPRRLAVGAALRRMAARELHRVAAFHAQHHLQRVAGLHRGLDGLWPAADLVDAAASGPRAGRGRPQRRRASRPSHTPRDRAAGWYGLIGSWLLMFLIFEREYSTGVYLLSPGTETIGSMLVSLWPPAPSTSWPRFPSSISFWSSSAWASPCDSSQTS